MTHGTADPLVPIAKVRPQIPLLKAAGVNVEWREFRQGTHHSRANRSCPSSANLCGRDTLELVGRASPRAVL